MRHIDICKEAKRIYETLIDSKKTPYIFSLYIRIHKPTKTWYVGLTKGCPVRRHNKEVVDAVLFKETGHKSDMYRKLVSIEEARAIFKNDEVALSDDWIISILETFDDEELAKTTEKEVIYELTKSYLPVNLCMNSKHVFVFKPVTTPSILNFSDHFRVLHKC